MPCASRITAFALKKRTSRGFAVTFFFIANGIRSSWQRTGANLRYSHRTGTAVHKDVRTTMIYTDVLNTRGVAVKSPLD